MHTIFQQVIPFVFGELLGGLLIRMHLHAHTAGLLTDTDRIAPYRV